VGDAQSAIVERFLIQRSHDADPTRCEPEGACVTTFVAVEQAFDVLSSEVWFAFDFLG
jgi:hypothetical protein